MSAAAPQHARPRVLMLSPYFLPAEQGGGSVRAILYLTQHLRPHFDFVVAARDHDLRSAVPYSEVAKAAARQADELDIHYLERGLAGARSLRRLLREPFDLIYLHSLMAADLALLPLLLLRLRGRPRAPLLIAPRGELMPGALAQRPRAKQIYVALLRATGLLRHAHFHATSAEEATAIASVAGHQAPISIAADLPPILPPAQEPSATSARQPGHGALRVLFLSRIDPVKNLGFALDAIARMTCAVVFDIAGPIGHDGVWADCQARMRRMPPNVQTRYLGAVAHAHVTDLFAAHDLLFLPTLGENHGYVVLEALSAGCPVLLSDRTPWRGLQTLGVGADLPLDDLSAFTQALAKQAAMPDAERQAQRARCRAHARQHLQADTAAAATRAMLERVIQPKARIPSTSTGQSGA